MRVLFCVFVLGLLWEGSVQQSSSSSSSSSYASSSSGPNGSSSSSGASSSSSSSSGGGGSGGGGSGCHGNNTQCGVNEEFSENAPLCPPQTCEAPYTDYDCSNVKQSGPGCKCKKNYARNKNGTCIPSDQCGNDHACGENEIWSEEKPLCPPQTCQSMVARYDCTNRTKSEPGCKCIDNYLRDDSGRCIPSNKCWNNHECGENEIWSEEKPLCPPQTCLSMVAFYDCRNKTTSEPGCKCVENYLRDDSGRCIPSDKCWNSQPKCRDDEEYSQCGTACEKNCQNNNQSSACTLQCVEGCFCKKDTIRKSETDPTCVKPKDCPTEPSKKCTGPHEFYSNCTNGCEKDCEHRIRDDRFCPAVCGEGCVCDKGYLRHKNGTCVLEKDCSQPKCRDDEEYSQCGTACEKNCQNNNQSSACTLQCVEGCFCKKDTIRKSETDPTCVKPKDCPTRNCSINEEYSDEAPVCPPQTCESIYTSYLCTEGNNTAPGCKCKGTYLRNKNGTCVPNEECGNPEPSQECTGPHEFFSDCTSGCETDCEHRIRDDRVCPAVCQNGCVCEKNYLRHKNGTCVPVSECSTPKCNKDEKHNTCGTACEKNCDNANTSVPCTKQCVDGCFCKSGTVRKSPTDLTCVSPDKCPPPPKNKCTGPHESFSNCTSGCERDCDHRYRDDRVCAAVCGEGCVCDEGYLRNSTGTCVKEDECTDAKCNKDEKYNKCGSPCQYHCQNYQTAGACVDQCEEGCFCKKGTIRKSPNDLTCVRPEDCPTPCTGDNEVYSDCTTDCARDCEHRFRDDRVCPLVCKPGCVCKSGYLRNDKGVCVKESKCSKPKCNKGEEYQRCGTACEKTCANANTTTSCTEQCVEGCFCIAGSVRASDTDPTCVCEKDCPKASTCSGPHEVYSNCTNGCETDCKHRFRDDRFCPAYCGTGCVCEEGYYRHDNGTCVLPFDCSPAQCNDDEEYKDCGTVCEDNCQNYEDTCRICTLQCVNGCFCKPGTVRASANETKCVAKEDCPKKTCSGKNEFLDSCPSNCPPTQNCSVLWSSYSCPAQEYPCCTPTCRCIKDHYRNDKGVCVSEKQCRDEKNCEKN